MWYYSIREEGNGLQLRSGAVSRLVEYIKHRMEELKRLPSEVADKGELKRQSFSHILNKEENDAKKGKQSKPVRPEPETIRKIAKGLDVEPALLTALMDYPTEPIEGIDPRYYEIAQRLEGAPWLANRMEDLLSLPRTEFEEVMNHLDYRLDQRRKARQNNSAHPRRNGNRSKQ